MIAMLRQFSPQRLAGCLTRPARNQSDSSRATSDRAKTNESEDLVMSQFLDLLLTDIEEEPSKLVPYTEEMSSRYRSLVSGVQIAE